MATKMNKSDARKFADTYVHMVEKVHEHLYGDANKADRSGAKKEISHVLVALQEAGIAIEKANGL